MTKLTYEDAEHADIAPYRALLSMGTARFPAFIHAVLPEILPAFLTNALYPVSYTHLFWAVSAVIALIP